MKTDTSEAVNYWKKTQRELTARSRMGRVHKRSGALPKSLGKPFSIGEVDYALAGDGSIRRLTPKYESKADRRNQIKARRIAKLEAA